MVLEHFRRSAIYCLPASGAGNETDLSGLGDRGSICASELLKAVWSAQKPRLLHFCNTQQEIYCSICDVPNKAIERNTPLGATNLKDFQSVTAMR
jgi:hypothetical protein